MIKADLESSLIGLDEDIGGRFNRGVDTPINTVDVADVSGGSTSNDTAQASERIEEFSSEGGGLLPIAYGEHFVAGHLVVHSFTAGSPNVSKLIIALGEGWGEGGTRGEWEAAVAVYYAGAAQSVSPDGTTAGYRFRPGTISGGIADATQPVDAFFSSTGLAYSGTAYIAVKLTDAVANAEDRPDKLRGRYKCRKTWDHSNTGVQQNYGYSVNPARVAADRIFAYYQRQNPGDSLKALIKLQEKVDWESWSDWKAYNAAQISWNNGTTTVNINRFDCNIVFTGDVILADALDQICATAGAFWQDDGEQLIFLSPAERDPVHHFDESNIISAPVISPRDLRETSNYYSCEFRDYDDDFMGVTATEVRRERLIKQVGEVKSIRALPPMRKSQADRLLERMARLESDNPNICSLTGDETSIHVLPGDFVTVSHSIPGWRYQRCLVLSVSITAAEDGPDVCEFTLQAVDDALYSDTTHGPRQETLTP